MPNRGYVRVAGALKVLLQDPGEEQPVSCMTKNLSLGGVFVLTERRWPVDTTMSVRLVRGPLEAESSARVSHVGHDGVGLMFVDAQQAFRFVVAESIADLVSVGAEVDEHRTEVRFHTDLAVTWRQGEVEHVGRLRDVGLEGAFVCGPNAPAPGTSCYLYLSAVSGADVPSGEICGCAGMVMHRETDGFGVHFEKPSDEFRAAVGQLVGWLNSGDALRKSLHR